MPCGGSCEHDACWGSSTGCRKLTDLELEPDHEDLELARELVADDWRQVSSKFRIIRKLNNPIGDWRDLVRPELHALVEQATLPGLCYTGQDILRAWTRAAWMNKSWVEERTLTVRQFKAFKKLGRQLAGH